MAHWTRTDPRFPLLAAALFPAILATGWAATALAAGMSASAATQTLHFETLAALRHAAPPDTTGTIASVAGYAAPRDGGHGEWQWEPKSIAVDNGGTVINPNSGPGPGRWQRIIRGDWSVRWFGARCGTTDSTPQIEAAMAALSAAGGGTLKFARCLWTANILIVKSNLTLRFDDGGYNSRSAGIAHGIVPADQQKPVLQIGDGSSFVSDVRVTGAGLFGYPANGTRGVLIYGANHVRLDHLVARGFADYQLRLTSSRTQPTSNNFIEDFAIATRNSPGSLGVDVEYGPSYTTPVFFSDGDINASAGGSYAIQVAGGSEQGENQGSPLLSMTNVWIQAHNHKGVRFSDVQGMLNGQNVFLDSEDSNDVLIEFAKPAIVQDHVAGSVTCDCVAAMPGGVTAHLSGQPLLPYHARLASPVVSGELLLSDASKPPHAQYDVPPAGIFNGAGTVFVENRAGGVNLAPAPGTPVTIADSKSGAAAPIRFGELRSSPNGKVAATPGSVIGASKGGYGKSVYVKQSGSGAAGWYAIGAEPFNANSQSIGRITLTPGWDKPVQKLTDLTGDLSVVLSAQGAEEGQAWQIIGPAHLNGHRLAVNGVDISKPRLWIRFIYDGHNYVEMAGGQMP